MTISFAQALKTFRVKAGLKQTELADKVGVTGSYICLLEVGKRPPPSDKVAITMEKVLGLAPKTLVKMVHWARTPEDVRQATDLERVYVHGRVDESGTEGPALRHIPLINKVAAGYPADFTDLDYPVGVADRYVMVPDVADPQAFAIAVCGESMAPRFREGDILVISPEATVTGGDFCFVRVVSGGQTSTTFKQVFFENGSVRLVSLNPAFPPQVYTREEVSGLFRAVRRVETL
jgi:phage repressor protein C with HTH and peptisase S24 domain